MSVRLIVLGLRRSGTTIFWDTLRQDRRSRCFSEPFNPLLAELPHTGLSAHAEFEEVLARDPEAFRRSFAPIGPTGELEDGLDERQRAYLQGLGETAENVLVKTTRCHFKIPALQQCLPDAVLVHLHRSPAAFATSHLLPSGTGLRGGLKRRLRERSFFTRQGDYDGWHLEAVVGRSPASPFGLRLREAGLDPEAIFRAPAVARLLALWKISHERAEKEGREQFGERFVSQGFEAFCRNPRAALDKLYGVLGWSVPEIDLARVHPAKPPHEPDSPEWERCARMAGVDLSLG